MDPLFIQVTQAVSEKWGSTTLSEFHSDALLEEDGIVFESLKANDRRVFLVVCVTDPDMIDALERKIDLNERRKACDWSQATVLEMLYHTVQDGLTYEDLRNESGGRLALIFCATTPPQIHLLEEIFGLPA